MRLLALDQATRTTGYSIFIDGKLQEVDHFNATDNDFGKRLVFIRNKIK